MQTLEETAGDSLLSVMEFGHAAPFPTLGQVVMSQWLSSFVEAGQNGRPGSGPGLRFLWPQNPRLVMSPTLSASTCRPQAAFPATQGLFLAGVAKQTWSH